MQLTYTVLINQSVEYVVVRNSNHVSNGRVSRLRPVSWNVVGDSHESADQNLERRAYHDRQENLTK